MALIEPIQVAQNETFYAKTLICQWHSFNRNHWHYYSEITGTNRTELARFIGENQFEDNSFFKGYTFTGDTVEHLTFIVLDKVGFVYLHGKGTVKKDDKTIVSLKDLISNYKW